MKHFVGNSRAFVWSPIDHDVYPANGPNRIDGPEPRSLSDLMVSSPVAWVRQFVAPALHDGSVYISSGDVAVLRIVVANPDSVIDSVSAAYPPAEAICTAYGEFAYAEDEDGIWHCCSVCGALLEETTQQAYENAMMAMAEDVAVEAWLEDQRMERASDV